MEKLFIICIDDQREVLSTLVNDLAPLEKLVQVEECESAEEARELIEEIDADGDLLAVVISDHVMPGENGVQFLSSLAKDKRFGKTRKVLLTGQATHQDTIIAINQAKIERYFEKPWDGKGLLQQIKILLTEYILDSGLDYQSFTDILDKPTLFSHLSNQANF